VGAIVPPILREPTLGSELTSLLSFTYRNSRVHQGSPNEEVLPVRIFITFSCSFLFPRTRSQPFVQAVIFKPFPPSSPGAVPAQNGLREPPPSVLAPRPATRFPYSSLCSSVPVTVPIGVGSPNHIHFSQIFSFAGTPPPLSL